jgi:hypothetical protein
MKDQNSITDDETKQEKWNRGLDIFIESVIKPDSSLRECAHNQKCYHELMDVRDDVLQYLNGSTSTSKRRTSRVDSVRNTTGTAKRKK